MHFVRSQELLLTMATSVLSWVGSPLSGMHLYRVNHVEREELISKRASEQASWARE